MLEWFDPYRGISAQALVLRMVLSLCCGSLIGIEREFKRRPAGFRTHILICMGAMLTTLTGEYLLFQTHDPVLQLRLHLIHPPGSRTGFFHFGGKSLGYLPVLLVGIV